MWFSLALFEDIGAGLDCCGEAEVLMLSMEFTLGQVSMPIMSCWALYLTTSLFQTRKTQVLPFFFEHTHTSPAYYAY